SEWCVAIVEGDQLGGCDPLRALGGPLDLVQECGGTLANLRVWMPGRGAKGRDRSRAVDFERLGGGLSIRELIGPELLNEEFDGRGWARRWRLGGGQPNPDGPRSDRRQKLPPHGAVPSPWSFV